MPAFLAPLISMLSGIGGWEAGSFVARLLGRQLLKTAATNVATSAGKKLAASAAGRAIEGGLARAGTGWLRRQLPESAAALPGSILKGAAGMGTLIAGMKGAEYASELFTPRTSIESSNLPGLQQVANEAELREALKAYTGASDETVDRLMGRIV